MTLRCRFVPVLAGTGLLVCAVSLGLTSQDKSHDVPLAAGQEASGPWWMKPTSLSPEGHFLGLKNRALWKKALDLLPGESFLVDDRGLPKDRVLIRKQRITTASGETIEAIVWVIDDDEDGSPASGGDRRSDCYIFDFHCDGVVDRIVDHIAEGGNGEPPEVEIREFENGTLKNVLILKGNLPDEGPWTIDGVDLVTDQRAPFPQNVEIYMNRFDPETGRWTAGGLGPLTAVENRDGSGMRAVYRVNTTSAAIQDIQIGFFFEDQSGGDTGTIRAGLAMAGHGSLADHASTVFHPRRRPPQETVIILSEKLSDLAETFPADEIGYSWREGPDNPVQSAEPGSISSWDDIFWTSERRPLGNAGISRRNWNIRREWSGRSLERREFYYSGVDRRIHLVGAQEGWIRIGHFARLGDAGEIRMFDTDGNGFFDRWEFHAPGRSRPVFTASVRDEKVRRLGSDLKAAVDFYRNDILPEALAENGKILEALASFRDFDLPRDLRAAAAGGPAADRRFFQDVLRDLSFHAFRDFAATHAAQALLRESRDGAAEHFGSIPGIRQPVRNLMRDKSFPKAEQAWAVAVLLARIEDAYGRGDFAAAAEGIVRMKKSGMIEENP